MLLDSVFQASFSHIPNSLEPHSFYQHISPIHSPSGFLSIRWAYSPLETTRQSPKENPGTSPRGESSITMLQLNPESIIWFKNTDNRGTYKITRRILEIIQMLQLLISLPHQWKHLFIHWGYPTYIYLCICVPSVPAFPSGWFLEGSLGSRTARWLNFKTETTMFSMYVEGQPIYILFRVQASCHAAIEYIEKILRAGVLNER